MSSSNIQGQKPDQVSQGREKVDLNQVSDPMMQTDVWVKSQSKRFEDAIKQTNEFIKKTPLDEYGSALYIKNSLDNLGDYKGTEVKNMSFSSLQVEIMSKDFTEVSNKIIDVSNSGVAADNALGKVQKTDVFAASTIEAKISKIEKVLDQAAIKVVGGVQNKDVIIKVGGAHDGEVLITLSKIGNEISIKISASNTDVLNILTVARQDLQYGLESKMSSTIVRIDVDQHSESDAKSKGEYLLEEEEEGE